MSVVGSIFEPHPLNFGKSDIFWRYTNDVTIIFGNFDFYKSWKKCTQARRPGVEESLARSALSVQCREKDKRIEIFPFSAGMYGLAAHEEQDENSARWMEIAKGITNTCHESYDRSDTKLGKNHT